MNKNTIDASNHATSTNDKVVVSSFDNSHGAVNTVQVYSTAQNIGRLNIGTTNTQAATPNITSATVTAPIASFLSQVSLPLLQSLISQVKNQVNNTTMSMQAKSATIKSNQPFVLVMLNNRIKKCCGCALLFKPDTPHRLGACLVS